MSRYQVPRDRFGRPLNPDNRRQGPGYPQQQPRGPQQPARGPQPNQPQRNEQSGRGPGRPDNRPNGGQQNGSNQRHPNDRFNRGGDRDRRNFRGGRGGYGRRHGGYQGQHRNAPPPPPKDQLTNDADAFWKAGRDLDLLAADAPPTPGITLKRLGQPPFGEHAAAVEATLRRTWVAATTAAAALLRR